MSYVPPSRRKGFDASKSLGSKEPTGAPLTRAMSISSRATSKYTVRPTRHLGQRQFERAISTRELQAAVKHGSRHELDAGRLRFEHNGVVYITESTGKRGITCYRLQTGVPDIGVTVLAVTKIRRTPNAGLAKTVPKVTSRASAADNMPKTVYAGDEDPAPEPETVAAVAPRISDGLDLVAAGGDAGLLKPKSSDTIPCVHAAGDAGSAAMIHRSGVDSMCDNGTSATRSFKEPAATSTEILPPADDWCCIEMGPAGLDIGGARTTFVVPGTLLPTPMRVGGDPLHCRGNIPAFGSTYAFWIYLHNHNRCDGHQLLFRRVADGCTDYPRVPGVWFEPNSTRLHYCISTDAHPNEKMKTTWEVPIREWTHLAFIIEPDGDARKPVLRIELNGGTWDRMDTHDAAAAAQPSLFVSESLAVSAVGTARRRRCVTETFECFGNFTYPSEGALILGLEPSPRRTGVPATVADMRFYPRATAQAEVKAMVLAAAHPPAPKIALEAEAL